MNDGKMWINVPGLALIVIAFVLTIGLIHFW
jgi:hypothetical protein